MTAPGSASGPVAEFCADLRELCRASGSDVVALAAELKISKSQLYAILNGEIKRPPAWTSLVRPLVAACTGGDARALSRWRQRHAVLVGVWEELSRRDRRPAGPKPGLLVAPRAACTLPAATAAFTGREDQLRQIADAVSRPGGVIAIHAIGGMPGIGKTALAVQAGRLVASRFPDRQLFVDLHGHTPGQPPVDPTDALATLLAADGVDPHGLPADLDGRAAMWRDRMAGQRLLLILDDAASSSQVAPLLPGTAECLVLVTSRRFLGDLPGAVTEVPLDTLPPPDGCAMFVSLAPRAAREPARVAELAALCGHLPLAISLLARLFARHQSWTMDDLIGETRTRLLTVTAENRTVAAAFELSYQDLTPGRQRFFRQLGLHPGADIDRYAAAALAGLPLDEAAGHLDALHTDHLLAEPVPRRYRLHDLIRQYARGLAAADPAGERERAADRLLEYYQHTAEAADARLAGRPPRPVVTPARPATPSLATPSLATPSLATPSLASRDHARAWLAAERGNLLAAIDDAGARHQHRRVISLTAAIAAFMRDEGPWPQARVRHAAAAAAARALGDRPGRAGALVSLGEICDLTGDFPGAAAALEQALEIYRELGDRPGEARALRALGEVRRLTDDFAGATEVLGRALWIARDLGDRPGTASALRVLGAVRQLAGDPSGAAELLEPALGMYRELGDRLGVAQVLLVLGEVRQLTGDGPGATEMLGQALAIYRGLGHRVGAASALAMLGWVHRLTGDLRGATDMLDQALGSFRELGDRLGEATLLGMLGVVRQATGDVQGAAPALEQSLGIYRDLGIPAGEAQVLNRIGALHLARGDAQQAQACHQAALKVARAVGSRLEEARALEGLGQGTRATAAADRALRAALELYRRIGAADAARLAADLDAGSTSAAR
jgi:tetratricopeptide (TPR) repeat protein